MDCLKERVITELVGIVIEEIEIKKKLKRETVRL